MLVLAMLTQLGSEGTGTEPRPRFPPHAVRMLFEIIGLFRCLEVYLELLKDRGYPSSLFSNNSMTWSAPEEVIMSHPLYCTGFCSVACPSILDCPPHLLDALRGGTRSSPPGAQHLV